MDRTRMEGLEMKDSAETEGARRATGVSAGGAESVPDPEVPEKAKRRQFSPEYRLRILREADACKAPGAVGALLRREGLYSSHLVQWRRQREAGALSGMRTKKRGPKGREEDPRLKQQAREIARLQRKLKQAETIIEIQKKVAGILGIPLNAPELDEND
jgi:transposase